MRLSVSLVAVLGVATGCFSFSQLDREEEARNRRSWIAEPEHIHDPVAFHASDLPLEGLDPPGPRPLFGPRRDPDTVPRQKPVKDAEIDRALDAWEDLEKPRPLEER
jgi:hypothetical protein